VEEKEMNDKSKKTELAGQVTGEMTLGRLGDEGCKDPVLDLMPDEKELYGKILKILNELGNTILPESAVRKNDPRKYLPNERRADLIRKKAVDIVLLMRKD
jgi:hypothetical protein